MSHITLEDLVKQLGNEMEEEQGTREDKREAHGATNEGP